MTSKQAASLNAARMAMEDGLLLRLACDAGDVHIAADILGKYSLPDPWQLAADLAEARAQAIKRPPVLCIVTSAE